MKTNLRAEGPGPVFTHEGGPAVSLSNFSQLERSVMCCMLWENEFYEDGEAIAKRIQRLSALCKPEDVASLAIMARTQMKLRSVPLLLAASLAGWKGISTLLPTVIQRADELAEFLAIFAKIEERKGVKVLNRLPHAMIRGLDSALRQFGENQLARNLGKNDAIKLRDVIRLVHPKPENEAQSLLWKRAIAGDLPFPDSWQTRLAAGEDKLATWTELLQERKLGALDILKNLRNMSEVGVESSLVERELARTRNRVDLPFRYLQAALAVPQWEPMIEEAMLKAMEGRPKLKGSTVLLVDVSGSMAAQISGKHKPGSNPLLRTQAAAAVAMLLREICEEVSIWAFSNYCIQVPPRRGMALGDAITRSQPNSGTMLGKALSTFPQRTDQDRIIVITDEQSSDSVGAPPAKRGYIVNVASAEYGVGQGPWLRINGFSESVVDFIQAWER